MPPDSISAWVRATRIVRAVPLPASGWLAPWPLVLVAELAAGQSADLRGTAAWQLVAMGSAALGLLGLVVWGWGLAGRRRRARLRWLVALAALAGLTATGPSAARRATEMGRIAFDMDPLPAVQVQLSGDGRTLWLRGALGTGSAWRVEQALRAASRLQAVHLVSPGGRVFEAGAIAGMLRARRLDTYADDLCASACTLVLLAGRQRGAAPQARIGFHRPQFAGQDDDDPGTGHALLRAYREAGLGAAFIARVRATPSQSMWYPTREELLRQRVLTQG